MAFTVWKTSTSPSILILSISHIVAMKTPVRDMPSLAEWRIHSRRVRYISKLLWLKNTQYADSIDHEWGFRTALIPNDVGNILSDMGAFRDTVCRRQFFILKDSTRGLSSLTDDDPQVESFKMKNCLRQILSLNARISDRIFQTSCTSSLNISNLPRVSKIHSVNLTESERYHSMGSLWTWLLQVE